MIRPTISIVTAAKNYAKFLPQAVESVFAQTYADWELIIVDDGSTDETPRIIRSYLADQRVKFHRSDRLGQSRTKNLGLRLSRGEFVAFLDADDIWLPTKLERQLELFHGRPELGVCHTRRRLIDEEGNPLPSRTEATIPRGRVARDIFSRNFVCFSSVMLRREVFDHVGSFDPEWDLSIDYDLWLRAARHYEFDHVDEELVLYRTGHGNLSKKLADRIATAESIMTRATERRGLELPRNVVNEGFLSTCCSLAYTLRSSEPSFAALLYLRAMSQPGRRREAIRGLIKSLLLGIVGGRAGSAENARANR